METWKQIDMVSGCQADWIYQGDFVPVQLMQGLSGTDLTADGVIHE